jgi:hypothetical protein
MHVGLRGYTILVFMKRSPDCRSPACEADEKMNFLRTLYIDLLSDTQAGDLVLRAMFRAASYMYYCTYAYGWQKIVEIGTVSFR